MAKLANLEVEINANTKKLKDKLRQLKNESDKATKKAEEGFKKTGEGAKKAAAPVSKLKNLIGSRFGLAAAFVTLSLSVRKAFSSMTDFQTSMAEVSTLINTNTTNMGRLNDKIVELSLKVPRNAVDISKGLYQTISAGITDVNDALFVTKIATKAAVAGLTDTNTAVDVITTVLNAYQKSITEANDVSDILFQTVKDGKTRFGELAQGVGTVASSAALANVSFEELGAAIATITKFGISTDIAVTALNRLFLQIVNPTETLRKKAADLGIEFSASALRTKGFTKFMQELVEAFGDNQDAIFELGLDIRSFRALSILGGTGAEEFGKRLDAMKDRIGAADTAFKKMNKTAASTWQLFKNKLVAVTIDFGEVVLPPTTKAVGAFGLAIDEIRRDLSAFGVGMSDLVRTAQLFFSIFKEKDTKKATENLQKFQGTLDAFGFESAADNAKRVADGLKSIQNFSLSGNKPDQPIVPIPESEDFVPEFEILNLQIKETEANAFDLKQQFDAIAESLGGFLDTEGLNPEILLTQEELNNKVRELTDAAQQGNEVLGQAPEFIKQISDQTRFAVGLMSRFGDAILRAAIFGDSLKLSIKEIIAQLASKTLFAFLSFQFGGATSFASALFGHTGGSFENGKKVASFAGGTSNFVVPSGFPNDSFPLLVESGERVQVTPAAKAGNEAKILSAINGAIQAQTMTMVALQDRQDVIEAQVNVRDRDLQLLVERSQKRDNLFR